MTTGAFWNLDNPKKPKGIKDPQAKLDYPLDFSGWLADVSDTIDTFTLTTTGGLVVDLIKSVAVIGVVWAWLSGGTPGQVATVTCHIVTTAGREDERTWYLKIEDR